MTYQWLGKRNRERTPNMTKFQIKPQAHRISKGAISTATAETSTVATADVMRKSNEDDAMRSMRDASINSLMLWILSIISWKGRHLPKIRKHNYAVPEKIHTHPKFRGGVWGGGEGVAKAKFFKGNYDAKLEIPGGWGGKPKNLPWGNATTHYFPSV